MGRAALLFSLLLTGTPLAGVVDDVPAGRELASWYGARTGAAFGQALAAAGDMDGDGVPDVLVGAPASGADGAGQVFVRSGADGRPLRSLDAPAVPAQFGAALAGGRDVNGDGVPEILVGAPRVAAGGLERGRAILYSGRSGRELRVLEGRANFDFLGSAVALLPDADGDGRPEMACGAHRAALDGGDRTGVLTLLSGGRDEPLFRLAGPAKDDTLAHDIDVLTHVDGDGRPDLVVGVLGHDEHGPEAGLVWVVSAVDGQRRLELHGAAGADRFGSAVAGLGDVDGDGRDDFAVGAPGHDAGGDMAGAVFVHSGADGSLITTILGGSPGDALGTTLALAGDMDGDGVPDLAATARQDMRDDPGYVLVCSARDGRVLLRRAADPDWQGLGEALAGVGDLDGDGRDELAVGAPGARRHGKPVGGVLLLSLPATEDG